jgi:DNA-binding NarL/FixJ family response regulator
MPSDEEAEKGLSAESVIRLLVVDDQRLIREGIATLMNLQALDKIQKVQVDVVLMDVRMPLMDGVEATLRLKRHYPDCKVLMLTTFEDEEYVIEALKAGANGYLLKNIPERDLAQAIIAVHQGLFQLDPTVAQTVVAALGPSPNPQAALPQSNAATPSSKLGLSEREREVLKLVAQGLSNSEISRKLLISDGTVKNHISNIISRLGLRDRIQAIIYARENGLF